MAILIPDGPILFLSWNISPVITITADLFKIDGWCEIDSVRLLNTDIYSSYRDFLLSPERIWISEMWIML